MFHSQMTLLYKQLMEKRFFSTHRSARWSVSSSCSPPLPFDYATSTLAADCSPTQSGLPPARVRRRPRFRFRRRGRSPPATCSSATRTTTTAEWQWTCRRREAGRWRPATGRSGLSPSSKRTTDGEHALEMTNVHARRRNSAAPVARR